MNFYIIDYQQPLKTFQIFLTGIVVFRAIILVITPPSVSTPNDNGVTSSNRISLISPAKIPA
jgi:hypothetical protein